MALIIIMSNYVGRGRFVGRPDWPIYAAILHAARYSADGDDRAAAAESLYGEAFF